METTKRPTEKEYRRWRILNGWSKEYIDEWMNEEPYYFFDFLSHDGARGEEGVREGEGEIHGETEGWVWQAWWTRYSGRLRRLAAGRWAARLAAHLFEQGVAHAVLQRAHVRPQLAAHLARVVGH